MKKIRVLHVIGHLGKGGDSTAVLNLMNYLEKNSFNIEFDFITHTGYDENLVNKLQEKKHKVYIIKDDARNIGIFDYYREISKILKLNKYDIIQFHTSFQSAIGLLAAKRNNVKKRIVHSHTTAIQRSANIIKKLIYIPICRFIINICSTDRVACSKMSGKFLFGKYSNFDVIYNGIEIERLKDIDKNIVKKIKNEISYKKGDVLIGQVGRFDENKNQLFSIRLVNSLPSNYKLILLGENNYINDSEYKNDKIFFEGKVKNIQDYMSLFDFLLLPSKYGEGLPTVVIEQQIVNENAICLVSDIVTPECSIGNVVFLHLDEKGWYDQIIKTQSTYKVDYSEFDIDNTGIKWLDVYLGRNIL